MEQLECLIQKGAKVNSRLYGGETETLLMAAVVKGILTHELNLNELHQMIFSINFGKFYLFSKDKFNEYYLTI